MLSPAAPAFSRTRAPNSFHSREMGHAPLNAPQLPFLKALRQIGRATLHSRGSFANPPPRPPAETSRKWFERALKRPDCVPFVGGLSGSGHFVVTHHPFLGATHRGQRRWRLEDTKRGPAPPHWRTQLFAAQCLRVGFEETGYGLLLLCET